MAKRKALITIDLEDNGGKKIFYSIDKIKEWIVHEKEYWTWVSPFANIYNIAGYYNKHYKAINGILNLCNKVDKDSQEFDAQINNIKSIITQYYINGNTIHSLSPKGIFLERLRTEDERKAAITFSFFYGNSSNNAEFILAAFEGILFEKGVRESRLEVDKKRSEKFLESIRENLSNSEAILDEKEIEINSTSQELASVLDQGKSDLENQLEEQSNKFGSLVETTEKNLSNIESVYDKKLAIQSSVRYWKTKAKSHESFLKKFYWIFSFAIIFSVCIVFLEIWLLFGDYTIETPPPYWVATIVILTLSVLIWFIRILAKIMLSNIHLQTDANERRVMILTYLSLLRRDKAITDDDRKVILHTLFRPSATGIIKDENLPNFIWDKFTSN